MNKLSVHVMRRSRVFALQESTGKIKKRAAGGKVLREARGPLKCSRGPPEIRGTPFENHCFSQYSAGKEYPVCQVKCKQYLIGLENLERGR